MMNKYRFVFVGMIAGVTLAFIFLWIGFNGSAQANPGQQVNATTPTPLDDEGSMGGLTFTVDQSDEIPPEMLEQQSLAPNAPNVLPTPIPGESQVFFIPSDNDATATVIYLYNTDDVAHIVSLRGFSYNGVLVYALNINVGATSFLRLASDSIASAPPPSWATPAPIITNFTDFTYYAMLSLPQGVRAEGYVLFNPGTGVVDPRVDQGAIPLRFSTDPATLFLPIINKTP
jgi:hypothetical protein